MEIQFVNHASYVLSHQNIRLICDPWLEGTAFDNGWKLLSKTKFEYSDFADITHLWLSHEHPDHFSPPCLLKIPLEFRNRITVLYHETNDQKVLNWCLKNGFKEVIEMAPAAWYSLASDFQLLCCPEGSDSWLYFKSKDCRILNLNDCVINNAQTAASIKRIINEDVDVLLTQFSYAQYEGNADKPEERAQAGLRKFEQIRTQVETFHPEMVVPFASFVWFCHEENYYMNDKINRIDATCAFLESLGVKSIALYPNDKWIPGTAHDNTEPISNYLKDYQNIHEQPQKIQSRKISMEELAQSAERFRKKAIDAFGIWLNFYFRFPFRVYLTDYGKVVSFNPFKGLWLDGNDVLYDVGMSSDALNFNFKFDWGFNTTFVNGRLQIASKAGYRNYVRYVWLGNNLNHATDEFNPFQRILNKIKRVFKSA